jgi:hypothetical protein
MSREIFCLGLRNKKRILVTVFELPLYLKDNHDENIILLCEIDVQ